MNAKADGKKRIELDIQLGTIDPQDGQSALEFVEFYTLRHKTGRSSVIRYYAALKAFLNYLQSKNKTLSTLTETDALALSKFVETSEWVEQTRKDYWGRFYRFYKWTHSRRGKDWDQQVFAWICGQDRYRYRKDRNKEEKQPVASPEEILRITEAEEDLGYKCFWSTLYESGCRSCELLQTLKIKDVEKDADGPGYTLHLRYSKTKKRPVHLIEYAPAYLGKWLQLHPRANDPDALLFVNLRGRSIKNEKANQKLKVLLKKTHITKPLTLHAFRRGRATELANRGFSEHQISKALGWVQGSSMPKIYIDDSAIDMRSALMKSYGYQADVKAYRVQGKKCLNCSKINSTEAESCDNCNLPLDPAKLEELRKGAEAFDVQQMVEKLLQEKYAPLFKEIEALQLSRAKP